MTSLFCRQFSTLFWKNWIILLRHPFLNILRCFLLPVGYGLFISVAQTFMSKPNNYGLGTSIPIFDVRDVFNAKTTLYWVDLTNGTTSPSPQAIMSHITQNFTSTQLSAVRQLNTSADVTIACPPNFQMLSGCFAAIEFNSIPEIGPINYTIRADAGLAHIDAPGHQGDFELRILPLQWAIDKAILKERTGQDAQTPLQWPFTQFTNANQTKSYRLRYVRGIRNLLVLALFVGYIGIAYQLPGAIASERALLITPHMTAMGLMDSAKVISWHLSHSLVYLPAWVVVSVVWNFKIFKETHVALIIGVHVLFGLSLASWSFFISAPFGKSPQLAAVTTTFLAVIIAIAALIFTGANDTTAFIFTTGLPPSFYVFAIRAICGFENHEIPGAFQEGDPDHGLTLLPLTIAATVNIFLWPGLAVILENCMYGTRTAAPPRQPALMKPGIAISIKRLGKTFSTSIFRGRRGTVTAVEDLTFDIPKNGIFVLLGSNGAGKSTTLSILGGLTDLTYGSVQFEGGSDRPAPGVMGIVPQKNVLFPELTCLQTLQVWKAIKFSNHSDSDEDLVQLLKDCDLGHKIHYNAASLSGGQKRRLQLAIGLVGGSKIVLVDECTSGVDPLSRRAIWRILTSVRHERTIVFTTHFLDEADLLADNIAILAAPGKLVAEGSPVSLKRNLGAGYSVQISLSCLDPDTKGKSSVLQDLLYDIRAITPNAYFSPSGSLQVLYHLGTKDPLDVQKVLKVLEQQIWEGKIRSYDILGTTLEDIFLDLMNGIKPVPVYDPFVRDPPSRFKSWQSSDTLVDNTPQLPPLELSRGQLVSPWKQAATIFYKRCLIAKRSWFIPLLSISIAVAGSTIPLVFLKDRGQSCIAHPNDTVSSSFPLYPPISPVVENAFSNGTAQILNSPPGLIGSGLLGNIGSLRVADVTDNQTFVQSISESYLGFEYGGISMDLDNGTSLIAWEAGLRGFTGPSLLNLVDNLLYNNAMTKSGQPSPPAAMIQANYAPFPPMDDGTLLALKWSTFFGATMAVYTAFFALYVATERATSVQTMQFSNGLSNPIGLWLGHLAFDSIFTTVAASIIIGVFMTTSGEQFKGLPFFWLVIVLYGIASTLFAYCVSQVVSSPLGAFAGAAGYEIVMFLVYFAGYLFTFTYGKVEKEDMMITIIHFTLSILSPIASVERAAFVSVNLFSLLCMDNETISLTATATIMRYGGPIIYLSVQICFLLGVLVRLDRHIWRSFWRSPRKDGYAEMKEDGKSDVVTEAQRAATSDDLLRVLGVSKTFGKNKVVDDVTLSAAKDTIFALLGPNGAGKTTTFNMIRGDMTPDSGDILIAGQSIIKAARKARFALGVCPQFTAIDSAMTVREHLEIYGRLKGLGKILKKDVQSLMAATALLPYADRLASKMSGGNQRKLALAIALMGNPSVILIDEFSTGVDAKMKRDMWITLRNVSAGKAVVITTHSMEEASALANKVGILAKRVLAVGTIDDMSSRYTTYEVHFTCRTREETTQAQILMSQIPGSRMADDVATRFEVPIGPSCSLAQLFGVLSSSHRFSSQFTVEKATLESIFLKVIRGNDVLEEEKVQGRRWT